MRTPAPAVPHSLALSLVSGVLGLLGACAGPLAPLAAGPLPERPVIYGDGVPSPATVKCAKLGGRTQLLSGRTQGGALGLCRLDRAVIDEWTLFWAATNHEVNQAAQAFLSHPSVAPGALSGDPAAAYCAAVGGHLVRLRDEAGHRGGICQFADDSLIEQGTLWHGPKEQGNRKLAALLRADRPAL